MKAIQEKQDVEKRKMGLWQDRIKIVLTKRAHKELCKKGRCGTVQNYQWYEIRVSRGPEVFDKYGNQIDKARLRSMLRKMS